MCGGDKSAEQELSKASNAIPEEWRFFRCLGSGCESPTNTPMNENEIIPDGIDRGLNILLTVKERFEALGGKAVIALNPGDYESAVEVLKAAGRQTSFLKRAEQDEEERSSGTKFTFLHEEDYQSSDSEILREEPDPRLPLWYQQGGPLVHTKRIQNDSENLAPKQDPRLPQWYQQRISSE